ncbi:metallophosphoesterase [Negadavirga shengliensis]|uniref:Metallophosphoesterase n=1 Tax=Negadavirga shengliensis TaxID=1389218 RepID=A0ABV9T1P8_9BACT
MTRRIFVIMICLPVFFLQAAFAQKPVKPLFSFGLISDVQYADAETIGKRNYRNSPAKLEKTLEILNAYDLSFIVNLGDLIDRGFENFDKPLKILERSRFPIHHVWGNHDFAVTDDQKKSVGKKLGNEAGYYSFEEAGFVFIVLNGLDFSMEGHPQGSVAYNKAVRVMETLTSAGANNAKPWNGGIGDDQLTWFLAQVKNAGEKGKRAVVFCHYPLLPENGLQLLNNRQLLSALDETQDVVAWFSGHHHEGNYVRDGRGIHHVTFQGMVEATTQALGAVISVYPDKIIVHGIGHEEDRVLEIVNSE